MKTHGARREPATNPDHIDGRRALLPLRHLCSPQIISSDTSILKKIKLIPIIELTIVKLDLFSVPFEACGILLTASNLVLVHILLWLESFMNLKYARNTASL